MQDLLRQYKKTRKAVVSCTSRLKKAEKEANCEEITHLKKEESILNSMVSDLEYAINWMECGHNPQLAGVERWGAYVHRLDTQLMAKFLRSEETTYSWDDINKENALTRDERYIIDTALNELTAREREIFLLKFGYCVSYKRIAEMLGIQETTVRDHVAKARKKMERLTDEDMFVRMYKME